MARFRNYLLVVIGFALAGAIGAAFGTGKAEAVVASLVQVANTASSPVVTLSVTDPGRLAYQSTVNMAGNCTGATCQFQFPTVPSGHRVVIQHIGGVVDCNPVPAATNVIIISGAGALISELSAPVRAGIGSIAFDQPVLFYVDSFSFVSVEVSIVGNGGAFLGGAAAQVLTLTGYELDCTVAACAPLATQ